MNALEIDCNVQTTLPPTPTQAVKDLVETPAYLVFSSSSLFELLPLMMKIPAGFGELVTSNGEVLVSNWLPYPPTDPILLF